MGIGRDGGAHAAQPGAGLRLGVADRDDPLAALAARQVARLLLRAAEGREGADADPVRGRGQPERDIEPAVHQARQRLRGGRDLAALRRLEEPVLGEAEPQRAIEAGRFIALDQRRPHVLTRELIERAAIGAVRAPHAAAS